MDWLFEPIPKAVGLIASGLLTVAVLAIAVTRLRGTRLAALAGANMAIVLMWTLLLGHFEPAPWRLQVLIQRLIELPLLCGLAVLCLVQARRLPRSESRLAGALQAAPVLLAGAWVVAFAGEQAWPRPTLASFAEMPVRNWALLTLLCVPFQAYLWCNVYIFARAAGSRSPNLRLRMQNFFLAMSVGCYGISSVNVLAGYAVLTFLENPARREVTLIQYAIEERLFFVWGPALLAGLLLAASPLATRAARTADASVLLPLRERFEGLTWRLETMGALRRLTRPLYYLEDAAAHLGLSKVDIEKARQTVKLAAIMGSPGAPEDLSRERASELLDRLRAGDVDDTAPTSSSLGLGRMPEAGDSTGDHLPDVLDAALSLSTAATADLRRADHPAWLELARVACVDAGIAAESDRADAPANPHHDRAFDAYRRAANIARGA